MGGTLLNESAKNINNSIMKKILVYLMLTSLIVPFGANHAKADIMPVPISRPISAETEAAILLTRLYEIDAMDKSSLGFAEKKALRKEVRHINSQLNELGNGVYISVGAIIIILLILIILL